MTGTLLQPKNQSLISHGGTQRTPTDVNKKDQIPHIMGHCNNKCSMLSSSFPHKEHLFAREKPLLLSNPLLILFPSWGRVLTLDQLQRRGRALANRCFLCAEKEEDINHLLLHCKKAKMLWDLVLSIVGTSWVFPNSVIQMLLAWQGAPVGNKRKKNWMATPVCLFWTVWHKRNLMVFENKATLDQRTKFLFLSKL